MVKQPILTARLGKKIPIGMINQLDENDIKHNSSKIGRIFYGIVGVALFSTLIGSCIYENFIRPVNDYQSRPREKIQEEAREYLKHISEDPTFR